MSWEATCGLIPVGAQHGRGLLIRPNRASSANMIRKRRPRAVAARRAFRTAAQNRFFKCILRLHVPVGMKRARHQLAPAVPIQETIYGAVAGWVPDRLLVGRFEI